MDSAGSPDHTAARRHALVDAYSAQALRANDGLKSLRHTLLRGPSAPLRELAAVIAERAPETAVTAQPGDAGGPTGDSSARPAAEQAAEQASSRADWLAMVAQVGWLQGEPDASTLGRYRALRATYGTAVLSEADVTAYLAAGGASLAPDERAELHAHPGLKATARASAASDAAALDGGIGGEAHLAALTKILGLPENMPLSIRPGAGTGPSRLTSKLSVFDRARSVFRETATPPSPLTVIVSAGSPADVAVTTGSLKHQVHPKVTVVTQGTDESITSVIARAPGDLLLFLTAGSWAAPTLASALAAAWDKAESASTTTGSEATDSVTGTPDAVLAVIPSAQWVDGDLRFAPAGSLLRLADSSSALLHRRVFAEVGDPFDVPADEALDEFITRVRRSLGTTAIARVSSPTLVLHPAGPLGLTDPIIPTQDWRAEFRSATLDSGRAGGVVDVSRTRLPFSVRRTPEGDAGRHFDVIFASSLGRAGWKGGSQESLLQEIRALSAQGLRLGLVHLEAPRIGGPGPGQLTPVFQELVDSGQLERLTILDRVTADVVTIRYPPVLQFEPDLPAAFIAGDSGIRAARIIIEANQGPAETDGSDRRYLVDDCDRTVEAIFGTRATWYPQGPLIRRQLEGEGLTADRLGDVDLPGILDPADWAVERTPLAGRRPVVGRYSRDHRNKWPDTWPEVLAAYGVPAFDFVSMGGHDALDELRGSEALPATWTLLDYNERAPREFLATLDFFAYFHHSTYVEAFGRAIAEAMASGAVVILPRSFAPVFGDGAVYCSVDEVGAVVDELAADQAAYDTQSEAGKAYATTHFGYDRYASTIDSLRALGSTPGRR